MKKLWVLLLIPLLFLTACGKKEVKETRTMTCTYEDGEESLVIEWSASKITTTTVIAYDSDEIAESNAAAFEVDQNTVKVSREGHLVTLVQSNKNEDKKDYDAAKQAYKDQGYKCK